LNRTALDFAIIASGSLGYFISIALVTTPFYKNRANNYLSLSIVLLSTMIFLGWYDIENSILDFINNILLEFLVAVTLFTYFLVQIEHEYLKKSWYKWLYVPFICSILIEVCIQLSPSFNLYSLDFDDLLLDIKEHTSFFFNVFLIFWGRKLIHSSTTISEEKKSWLLRLNLFMIFLITTWFISNIEFHFFSSEYVSHFLLIMISFLLWWVLYYGVFKLQVLVQKDELHQYLVSKNITETRPKKKISQNTISKISEQLYLLMDEEELYKDPLLSRQDLATRLGTNEGYLSQILNKEMNKSVIQFVNEYRIEAAKNLLQNPLFNKYSIEAIGLEAGFKSKSAFYSAFKTSMKMSPGAFRKL